MQETKKTLPKSAARLLTTFSSGWHLFSTEGALRLPTTYDFLSQSRPQSLFNHPNAVSSISFDLLDTMIYDLKRSKDLRCLFDPVLHSSSDDPVYNCRQKLWLLSLVIKCLYWFCVFNWQSHMIQVYGGGKLVIDWKWKLLKISPTILQAPRQRHRIRGLPRTGLPPKRGKMKNGRILKQ